VSDGLLLRDAQLFGGAESDVRIRGGHIETIAPAGELTPLVEEQVLDLSGYLLLPAPAEPHAHLDKAFTSERFERAAPDLLTAIEQWHAHRATLTVEDVAGRARAAALETLAHGATAIRTHVDVGEGIRLRGVEALLAVRDELRELIDIQIVALAYPVAGEAGADNHRMLCEAAEMGVDLIGGAPHVTDDPSGDLEFALEVAGRYGIGVDLHTDERMEESHGLEELCQRCADGFAHPATASHCVSLGTRSAETQAEIAALVTKAGVGVVTCPLTNLLLQGLGITTSTPRGLTAIHPLLNAGAALAAGGDNVQDVFNPIGCGDPLQTAQLVMAAGQLDAETSYRLVSDGARAVMGLSAVGFAPGAPAELLAVRARSLTHAIATATEDRMVIRGERVVVRTRVEREIDSAIGAFEVV
jgi:cytosine/creatinine deaminase